MLINLTPHDITLRTANGEDIVIAKSGSVARVSTLPREAKDVDGLPVPVLPATQYGDVEGLPDAQPGVAYIVSSLVLSRVKGRADVYAPATGPKDGAIRNEKRHIVAVTRLISA